MTVVSEQGRVRAEQVVLAGNCHLGGLAPTLRARIMPVGTYIIATAPLGEARARQLLPGDDAVSDCHFVLDYFRRSADHRLLFGGKVSYSGLPPANLKAAMRRDMIEQDLRSFDIGDDRRAGDVFENVARINGEQLVAHD